MAIYVFSFHKAEFRFFFRWNALKFPREALYRAKCSEVAGAASYSNVPRVCGAVVEAGLASLLDLKRDLTLEDAYMLYEILQVRSYNNWLANTKQQEAFENAKQ